MAGQGMTQVLILMVIAIVSLTSSDRGTPSWCTNLSRCPCSAAGDSSSDLVILCDRKVYMAHSDMGRLATDLRVHAGNASLRIIVSHNPVSKVPNHTFSSLHIRNLSLNHLSIEDIDPDAFHGLQNTLEHLSLEGTSLKTLKPSNFLQGFNRLKTLNLAYWHGNRRRSVLGRDTFGDLPSLVTLKLTKCNISDLHEGVFLGMAAIEEIYLNYNELTNLTTGVFTGLTSLKLIHLGRNQIQNIGDDVFASLHSLQSLHLQHNRLSIVPAHALSVLTQLQELFLGYNIFIPGIFPRDLAGVPNLRTLSLVFNGLREIRDGTFAYMNQLEFLTLNMNYISAITNASLAGLHNLKELSIVLNIVHMEVSSGAFSHIRHLEMLVLDTVSIELDQVHLSAFNGTLRHFEWNYARLSTFPIHIVGQLRDLERLSLRGNAFGQLPEDSLSNLTRLKYLDLHDCVLNNIPQGAFQGLPNGLSVDVSRNNLSSVTVFMESANPTFKYINLQNNRNLHCTCAVLDLVMAVPQVNGKCRDTQGSLGTVDLGSPQFRCKMSYRCGINLPVNQCPPYPTAFPTQLSSTEPPAEDPTLVMVPTFAALIMLSITCVLAFWWWNQQRGRNIPPVIHLDAARAGGSTPISEDIDSELSTDISLDNAM